MGGRLKKGVAAACVYKELAVLEVDDQGLCVDDLVSRILDVYGTRLKRETVYSALWRGEKDRKYVRDVVDRWRLSDHERAKSESPPETSSVVRRIIEACDAHWFAPAGTGERHKDGQPCTHCEMWVRAVRGE